MSDSLFWRGGVGCRKDAGIAAFRRFITFRHFCRNRAFTLLFTFCHGSEGPGSGSGSEVKDQEVGGRSKSDKTVISALFADSVLFARIKAFLRVPEVNFCAISSLSALLSLLSEENLSRNRA